MIQHSITYRVFILMRMGLVCAASLPEAADESMYVHVSCNVWEMVMKRRFMFTVQDFLGWALDNMFDSGE